MIWFGLMIAITGYIIYRIDKKFKIKYEDKFNPKEWELPDVSEPQLAASTSAATLVVKQPQISSPLIYERKDSLFSNAEKLIFDALTSAVADEYKIFAKVAVTDIIDITSVAGSSFSNPFIEKQFSFVICDKNTLKILCAIEFNDKFQPEHVAALNDSPFTSVCTKAKLPLLRLFRQLKYDVQQLREQIHQEINVFEIKEQEPKIISGVQKMINTEAINASKPINTSKALNTCPKCSATMIKRKAKNTELWVCVRYPECRGLVAIGLDHPATHH